MQIYYIVRPKQNLVLGMDLLWKKPSECIETDSGLVLGLEMKDALNVAAWVSFDGITAIPYPETTANSLFEKNLGKEYSLKKKIFLHDDFTKAVSEGIFPESFLRKPLNKVEKKLLLSSRKMKSLKKGLAFDDSVTTFSKRDLRGDNFTSTSRGVENVYYIVNMKRNLFLTKSLTWIDIGSIRKDKKLISQLFCVRDDIVVAQTVSLWVNPPGENIFPCISSTLKRKYRLTFPNSSTDFFFEGIRSHKYPAFLSRKPENQREIVAFQMALREGMKNIEERTLLSLGQLPENLEFLDGDKSDGFTVIHESSDDSINKLIDTDNLLPGKPLPSEESDSFSFRYHASSVIESSDLIRSIIETSVAFGKMMSEAQGLVTQKRVDLEMIHRQLIDLDHVAEFYSLNSSDGYRMNRARKEILQQRRIIKNEIIVLDMISSYFSSKIAPSGINGFVNGVMNLDQRCYTTRALTVTEVKNLIRNPQTQAQILGVADLSNKRIVDKKENSV